MSSLSQLSENLSAFLGENLLGHSTNFGELTCGVKASAIKEVCQQLRDNKETQFDQLIDLCGMDYLSYGAEEGGQPWEGSRYAVVYHLMSLNNNFRIRVRASLDDAQPVLDSIREIWPAADWFEREAFDLYGIIFNGHPDLRRLLTDYGFIGHPFRKDFPLSGQVEMRYDEEQGRVIYVPVTVDDRILVPRTIRKDTFSKAGRESSDEASS